METFKLCVNGDGYQANMFVEGTTMVVGFKNGFITGTLHEIEVLCIFLDYIVH